MRHPSCMGNCVLVCNYLSVDMAVDIKISTHNVIVDFPCSTLSALEVKLQFRLIVHFNGIAPIPSEMYERIIRLLNSDIDCTRTVSLKGKTISIAGSLRDINRKITGGVFQTCDVPVTTNKPRLSSSNGRLRKSAGFSRKCRYR